jgi:DHA1 family bicyclomycin/chloramphenicol resistance-like MFS transporter
MGFKEFVALIASLMAVNAMAIDAMLPALSAIGDALSVSTTNQAQWVVTAFLLGTGIAQLIYGPLADRFGRKPILLIGVSIYTAFSVAAAFADSFAMMVAARGMQGVGAASSRVLMVSIVRDCYSGGRMARVMSLAFIVYLAVPIVAPSIGQLILLIAPWRLIFGMFALLGAVVILWVWLRLPETLKPEDRRKISPAQVVEAFGACLSDRFAVGYMLAATLMVGVFFAFINSSQQIFAAVFHDQRLFPVIFAVISVFLGISSFANSRLVGRFGTRLLSHISLLGMIAIALFHLAVAVGGRETLWIFTILQSAMMLCFGIVISNVSTMAMEPLGHVAGTASSAQGFVTTVGGALLCFVVGQQFNGTVVPLAAGTAGMGLATLAIVFVTEKGNLFRATAAGISTSFETEH